MSAGAGTAAERFAGRRLHFIAIGGAGMSGLALVLHGLGAEVTGSDRAESTYIERLRAAGLAPRIGHDPEAVPADAEVVVSTAIAVDNPELVKARERGQRVLHRSELLAELCETGPLIAIAGAHGKTTTAGMVVHALRGAGAEPAFLLGGELPGGGPDGKPANAAWGSGSPIVAEADESDGSFLRLRPRVAVITNLELDHHAHWAGEAALREAFERFAASAETVLLPASAPLEASGAGRALRFEPVDVAAGPREAAVGAAAPAPVIRIQAVKRSGGGSEFVLRLPGAEAVEVRLAVPGRHNVANAAAALSALWAAGAGEGLPPLDALAGALGTFPGMARRLERKGEVHGAVIYDDYAHHPTEVGACLAALRELPHRRLIAAFQPHLYSRTKALARRFGRALAAADSVAVLDVYPAREEPVGELAGVSGLDVAEAVAEAAPGKLVRWTPTVASAEAALRGEVGSGDIVVTIGAGDVHRLAEQLAGPAEPG